MLGIYSLDSDLKQGEEIAEFGPLNLCPSVVFQPSQLGIASALPGQSNCGTTLS